MCLPPEDGTTVSPDAAGVASHDPSNPCLVKRVAVVSVSVLIAATVALLVGDPRSVAAATGGKVDRCGGGRGRDEGMGACIKRFDYRGYALIAENIARGRKSAGRPDK